MYSLSIDTTYFGQEVSIQIFNKITGRPDRRRLVREIFAKRSKVRGRDRKQRRGDRQPNVMTSDEKRANDLKDAKEIANMWEALSLKIIQTHPHIDKVGRTVKAFESIVMDHYHDVISKK